MRLIGLAIAVAVTLVMTSWLPVVTSSVEEIEKYHIQVRIYVDDTAFNFWKGMSKKTTFEEYATEIRSYFTEVQKVYDSLEQFGTIKITFEIESITRAKTDALSNPYIRSSMTPGLESFRNSIYFEYEKKPYDIALLFTSYRLGGTKVGYAFINRACSMDAVGVIQEKDTDTVVLEIAHEIGHILGANHDDGLYEDLDCYKSSGEVMNPSIHKFSKKKWTFSSCSNSDFEHHLRALGRYPGTTNCLQDGSGSVNATRLGTLIPPDDYCKRDRVGGDFVSRTYQHEHRYYRICDLLSCSDARGQNSHVLVSLQGLQCGKNKVCNRKVCEESYDGSPFVTDECPLGDQPRLPPNFDRSCNDIDPSECSKYMTECCLTCNKTNPIFSKTADEVCQELAGSNFVMLRSSTAYGDNLCSDLTCMASSDGKHFDKNTYRAPNGMACGKNKRCSWGKCVATKHGNPDIPDQCPFGDLDLPALGYKGTCEKYSKSGCKVWGTSCCQSCKGKN